jgi:hypothetical protein
MLVFDVFPCFRDLPEDIQRYVSVRTPRPAINLDFDMKERISKVLPEVLPSEGVSASWQRYIDVNTLRTRFDRLAEESVKESIPTDFS